VSPFVHAVFAASGIGVAATSSGGTGSAQTTHTVTLPSGSTTGDLVLIVWHHAAGDTTITGPGGWSSLSLGSRGRAYHLVLSGSVSTVDVTTASSRNSAYTAYRFTGAHGNVERVVSGTNVIDPPSLTPTWGSAENAWVTGIQARRTDNTVTAPSGYGSQLTAYAAEDANNSTSHVRVATAHKIATATSDDPDAWGTTGTLDSPIAFTIAVRPA
jgi:hypothetical protein